MVEAVDVLRRDAPTAAVTRGALEDLVALLEASGDFVRAEAYRGLLAPTSS